MMQNIRQIEGRWTEWWRTRSASHYQRVAPSLSHNVLHPEKSFSLFYNKVKKEREKKKKKEQLAQCPCILCFPDAHVWNNGSFAWIGAKDCWTCPLKKNFGLTIETFIQRSQSALRHLPHWADLWSSLSCVIAESLRPLQCPFSSSLRNKRYFKNLTYSIQFQRLASRKLLSSLHFIFLWSNASFLVFCLLSLVSVFLVDSSIIPLYIIKFL